MVIAGSPDKPLAIDGVAVPVYVLEDETRVLGRQGMIDSLALTIGSREPLSQGDAEMPIFVRQKWLQPFISAALEEMLKSPILYKTPAGQMAHGYTTKTFGLLSNDTKTRY